jgi:hypothetical protein
MPVKKAQVQRPARSGIKGICRLSPKFTPIRVGIRPLIDKNRRAKLTIPAVGIAKSTSAQALPETLNQAITGSNLDQLFRM